jgi:hypothetical protein
MRKIFLSVAAGVLGLTLAGTAEAHNGGHGHRGHGGYHGHHGHVHGHGIRFKGGYYYRGRSCHFWTRRVWDSRCHRYQFWSPAYNCYYYWYAPANCYYPVTFCP